MRKFETFPLFELENWAVIALGGIPNNTKVGNFGINGRIFHVGTEPAPLKKGELSREERWYAIQVKQKDKAGDPTLGSLKPPLPACSVRQVFQQRSMKKSFRSQNRVLWVKAHVEIHLRPAGQRGSDAPSREYFG